MATEQCPLCSGSLEVRQASPCHECGGDPVSLERFRADRHIYHSVKVFGDQELILCDSCMLNFGAFDPDFFGQPKDSALGFEHMEIGKQILQPSSRADMYCPACKYRLRFLKFVKESRKRAAT